MKGKGFKIPAAAVLLCFAAVLPGCGRHRGSSPPVAFRAADFTTHTPSIYEVSARKVAEGVHCYIYLEQGHSVPQGTINAIMTEFDNNIYQKNTATFGAEPTPGVDNDAKIYILLLDIRDGFNPTANSGYIAGYFDSGNEYPRGLTSGSNEKEILYIDINPAVPASPRFFTTLAHEFQHMIHWEQKNHLRDVSDEAWLNEGMSEIAGAYCGYGPSYGRVLAFEQAPTDSLTAWNSTVNDYGIVYMWAQYFMDRFSAASPNIFRLMLHNNQTGISSVDDALGQIDPAATFSATFRDWAIALYSGSSMTWAGNPEWSYTSIDTWPGTYHGITLPGLFPSAKLNRTSPLPGLGAWSLDYYSYTPLSRPTGTLTWTAPDGSSQKAALADSSPAVRPDLASGQEYTFSGQGYLIISNASGLNAVAGDTVTITSLLKTSTFATPKAMLDEANENPAQKGLFAKTGEPQPVCVHPYFTEREKSLRAKGARPGF